MVRPPVLSVWYTQGKMVHTGDGNISLKKVAVHNSQVEQPCHVGQGWGTGGAAQLLLACGPIPRDSVWVSTYCCELKK